MLLSKTDLKTNPLSAEQLKTIVCGGVRVDQSRSDIAVVPGCEPKIAIERAEFAYSFCQKVGGENIIVSGGVKHPYQGTLVSESELMGRYLIESGVKKEKIFSENRSRNTIENIIYSVCVIRQFRRVGDTPRNDYHFALSFKEKPFACRTFLSEIHRNMRIYGRVGRIV